ncbi:MAG TPA: hypothetical protein VK700_18425 [Steroidobacteraceae bacterium]|jgi:hypothetical protein|nr:hypothetical protein [Steroidobacteraceae bacterium]
MSLEGNVDYALTRVQSQYAARADGSQWRRLEASHDLGQYLEGARTGIFGPWIASVDRNRDAHAIERTLRAAWRRYVRTVAAWHPRAWQSWLSWLEWLPTLGLIAALEHPDTAPAWLCADPVLGQKRAWACFDPAVGARTGLGEQWLRRWRQLRPPLDCSSEQLLAKVCKAVREHLRQLALDSADAVALRTQLRERLQRLFRAAAGTPIATLCHLALMALDFERLRGGLLSRSLFGRGG